MIIRHGEKPDKNTKAMRKSGEIDKNYLTVKGWQRAGALTHVFNAFNSGLGNPHHIFACDKSKHSQRAVDTVKPLSKLLAVKVRTDVERDQEKKLAKIVDALGGIVLISWEHQCIAKIVKHLTNEPFPTTWPDDRFDMVYVLDLIEGQEDSSDESLRKYSFTQIPQMALHTDCSELFPMIVEG